MQCVNAALYDLFELIRKVITAERALERRQECLQEAKESRQVGDTEAMKRHALSALYFHRLYRNKLKQT